MELLNYMINSFGELAVVVIFVLAIIYALQILFFIFKG